MAQKKRTDKITALKKLQRYCAYQDRCHQEVRTKLIDLGVYGNELEEVIAELIEDNFLNEERFACSYARGKFRMKVWGKMRIVQELKRRRISAYCIKKALKEIDDDDYQKALKQLIIKKKKVAKEKNPFKLNKWLADSAYRRGFESDLIWATIKELDKKTK